MPMTGWQTVMAEKPTNSIKNLLLQNIYTVVQAPIETIVNDFVQSLMRFKIALCVH